ncbi:MAG: TonB-dependent receptor [Gemmatimonadota bacterium]
MIRHRPWGVVLAVALLPSVACSHTTANRSRTGPNTGDRLITAEQIERSGSHSAWEVLKHEAPMLTLEEDRNGQPVQLRWRGRSSVYLDDAPVVVLDGVRVADWRVLAQVPAGQIESIHILTGIEGTTYYGTNAVSGVIEIRTKRGPES